MATNFARSPRAVTGSILALVMASVAASAAATDDVPSPAHWSIEIVSGVVAGAPSTMRFVVEARRDLAAGDVVEIFPPLCAPFAAAQWSPPHLAAEGGVAATGPGRVVSDDSVRLSTIPWPAEPLCYEIRGKLERLPLGIRAELLEPLPAGRRFEILYGDPGPSADGRAVAQAFPEPDVPFRARWRSGDETIELERTGPPLSVGRRSPARLHVSGPADAEPGIEFRCRVAALDEGGFPAARRAESLAVRARHESGAVAGSIRLDPGEDPCVTLATFSLDRTGLWWIGAEAEGVSSGFDLPVRIAAESPRERLVFGDLHWHSNRSDGSRSPSDGYHYARDVVGLDFTARTDHDVHHQFPCLDGAKWPEVVADARAWTVPGEFVVIPAYEWTSGRGHLCVYFRTDPGAMYSVLDYGTPEALWAVLDPANVITIPHHPAGVRQPPWNWRHFDPAFVRALEIYSNKGNAEVVDANWAPPLFGSDRPRVAACRRGTAQSAWSQGRDCAVVASTDNHAATPGNPVAWRGDMDWQGWAGSGLAAARVPALTREALWDAIHAGATYGTTGPRVRLELVAEGKGTDRVVTAHVVGADDLETVELVGIPRQGEQPFPTVATATAGRHPRVRSLTWSAPDESPWRGVYLRVIQEDGEMAWSSPLFFASEAGVN